jgi:hypothetical protein
MISDSKYMFNSMYSLKNILAPDIFVVFSCHQQLCLILPLFPFQIVGRFNKFRYIIFAMYLDIVFI